MPLHECCNALVELIGHLALAVEIARPAPMDVSVGVVVDEPHCAATRQHEDKQECAEPLHQKLSTVICPGARRRCLRIPRLTRAAVASFSICGLPQSMTCEFCGVSAMPAAFASRPSLIAAGIRPASAPRAFSRLTNVT